ncbi:Y-family DNA polymerase [Comamonas jiangduensis]|uniref:Y-family DNA polymerase n=1 Tax=Comamonas jiangduensis TaxID=1194168 RepID=UPI0024E18188|nr:Y-family DNA polymerase [Comamonas jiangduensis]
MFALIDGNNFYVSCERAFQPALRGRPVVVLSNNDGCAISRSDEAKALGIKMAQPYYQFRELERTADLVCLSANFELYGDMSARMMAIAAGLGPLQEIYSIDESFIGDLEGIPGLTRRARAIRSRIGRWTSIPTCIGLAPTKTLAKLCNHIAKNAERKPGSYPAELARVCNWAELTPAQHHALLQRTPAGDVWGIGRRMAAKLAEQGIHTAFDLARMPAAKARGTWSVVLECTVRELQGTSCISLEHAPAPKQQIACTRSFGHAINAMPPLVEAVSEFATWAAEKLRHSHQLAGALLVFAHTSPFRQGPRFNQSITIPLQRPTSDTRTLLHAAVGGLRKIYQPGFELTKAGVMLLDLCPANTQQQTELLFEEPRTRRNEDKLMEVMDRINARYGKATVHLGSTGHTQTDDAGWRMKQEHRTPRYTTRLDEIPIARA